MRRKRRLCLSQCLLDETPLADSASVVDEGKRSFCPSVWFSSTLTVRFCLSVALYGGDDRSLWWVGSNQEVNLLNRLLESSMY
uniref:Uncharacterized protein n=1 Tax=Brassica campestris TaxID=3711 RepID=M4CUP3_BRACM